MSTKQVDTGQCGLLLIDEKPLRRACVASLIKEQSEAGEFAIISLQVAGDYIDVGLDVGIIVFNLSDEEGGFEQGLSTIQDAKSLLPSAPIAVLSARDDPPRIVEAFKLGARGFISYNTPPQLMMQALRFILAGGQYFPHEALLEAAKDNHRDAPVNGAFASLTIREQEVWRELQSGHSNKRIARSLSLAEATVKVHVRRVMRKLGVSNRTQAALLANGMGPLDGTRR